MYVHGTLSTYWSVKGTSTKQIYLITGGMIWCANAKRDVTATSVLRILLPQVTCWKLCEVVNSLISLPLQPPSGPIAIKSLASLHCNDLKSILISELCGWKCVYIQGNKETTLNLQIIRFSPDYLHSWRDELSTLLYCLVDKARLTLSSKTCQVFSLQVTQAHGSPQQIATGLHMVKNGIKVFNTV